MSRRRRIFEARYAVLSPETHNFPHRSSRALHWGTVHRLAMRNAATSEFTNVASAGEREPISPRTAQQTLNQQLDRINE